MTWFKLARLSTAFLYLVAGLPAAAQQVQAPTANVGAGGSGGTTVQVFTGDFNPRGAWAPNTAYAVKDVVSYQGSAYVVTQAYTSGAGFTSPNLALLVAGGQPGPAGNGVTGGFFTASGHLILNLSNGTTSDAGPFPMAPAGSAPAVAASVPAITFGTPSLDSNGTTFDVAYTVTPSATGTPPVTYQVGYKAGGAGALTLVGTSGTALTGTITGLPAATSFSGVVVASNVLGPVTSAAVSFSTPAAPVPLVAPSAPAIAFGNPTLDANGTSFDVGYTVTPSATGTAPITYAASYHTAGGASVSLGSALSGTITGLAPSNSFSGSVVATNAVGGAASGAVSFSTPALPTPAAPYVAFAAPVPNVIYQVDASEPASTAGPAAGAPGLKVDASGNLLGGNEAISQVAFGHGYGAVSLVTTAGPNGKPYLHGTGSSFNNAYDGIVFPATDAAQFFAQGGQSWHISFVIRQTGANSTGLFQAYNSSNNQNLLANWGSDGTLHGGQNTGGATLNEPAGPLTAFGQWEILDFYGNGQNGTISTYRNCQLTYTSGDSNPLGNLTGTTAFELLNNPQADVALVLIGNGLPSQSQHQANCNALASRYAIPGAIATVSSGPTTAIPPLGSTPAPAPTAGAALAPSIALGAPIPQQNGQAYGLPYTIALASGGGAPTDLEVGLIDPGSSSYRYLGNVGSTLTGVLNGLPAGSTYSVDAKASNSSNTSPAVGAGVSVTLPAALPLVGSGGGANVATAVPALPGIFAVYLDNAGASGNLAAFNKFMGFTGAAATQTALHVFGGNASQSDYENSFEFEDYQGLYAGPRVFSIPNAWAGPNGRAGETIPQAATGAFNGSYARVATQILNRMTHSNVTLPGGQADDQRGSLDQPQAVVYIRGPWEFNQQNGASNAWVSGNGGAASYAQWQQAWQQWVTTFRTTWANYTPTSSIAKPQFKFVWCATFQGEDPMQSYPGDAYVDVIASDLYMNSQYQGGITDPDALFENIKTTNYGLDWITSTAAAHGKMEAVPEWGVNQDNAGAYFDHFDAWAVAQGSNLAYIGYWQSDSSYYGNMSDGYYPQSGAEFQHLFNPAGHPVQAIPYPANVAATGGNNVALVSGTADPANANVTGYNLYAGSTSYGENLATPVATSSTPSFTATLANGSTGYYRIAAKLANGTVGTLSPEVSATALAPPANAPPYAVAMGSGGSASTAVPAAFQPPAGDFWKMVTFTPTAADLQSNQAALIGVWGGSGYVAETIFQLSNGTLLLALQNSNQYPTMKATVPGGMVAGHPYTAWVHYEHAAGRATFFLDPAGHTGPMTQLGAPVIGTPGFSINTAQCSYPPNAICPAVVIGNVAGGNPSYQLTGSVSEAAILDDHLNPILDAKATASGFSDASPGSPVWALQGSAAAGGTGQGSYVPLPTPLPPDPAGTFAGLNFVWANRGNATVSGGGGSPLVLTAPSNGAASNKHLVVTPLPAGDFRAVIRLKFSSLAENYVNGGVVMVGSNGLITSLFDILTDQLALSTFTGFQGQNENHLQGGTAETFANGGSDLCMEFIRVNGQYSAFAEGVNTTSNTCPAGGWVPFGSAQTAAALGNPVSVGISADDIDETGANVPFVVTLEAIRIDTGTDPQAAF